MNKALKNEKLDFSNWISKCTEFQAKFENFDKKLDNSKNSVDAYHFFEKFSELTKEGDTIAIDSGSLIVYAMQSLKLKKSQRLISSSGLDNQSFALPASIGVCLGTKTNVYCICEDPGFLKNVSELETIMHYKLPIKIIVFNTDSYSSVKKTQKEYFGGRYVASQLPKVSNFVADLGKLYKIPTFEINNDSELGKLDSILSKKGPMICEINVDKDQQITPRITFTVKPDGKWIAKPLEDMYPFLDRKTFKESMLVEILDED